MIRSKHKTENPNLLQTWNNSYGERNELELNKRYKSYTRVKLKIVLQYLKILCLKRSFKELHNFENTSCTYFLLWISQRARISFQNSLFFEFNFHKIKNEKSEIYFSPKIGGFLQEKFYKNILLIVNFFITESPHWNTFIIPSGLATLCCI